MKDQILNHLNNPGQLEKLYRDNKAGFKRDFGLLYPQLQGNGVADCWHERLTYENEDINWGNRKDLLMVLAATLTAGLIAKIPVLLHLNEDYFFPRNIGFIIFPLLAVYFGWKNRLGTGKAMLAAAAMLAGLLFINWLPDNQKSDTLTLSCMHLLLFLWAVLGFAFAGGAQNNVAKRLGYLKYNGDLIVITTLIVIAGGITTAITINLFMLAGFKIVDEYIKNIPTFGLPGALFMGTYLTQTNPQLVGRISPVIARLFSPLVLVMLVVYLIATAFAQSSPYHNREFLLIFNALLIGVMALIFFSVAENPATAKSTAQLWVLFLLSVVTMVVNGIALSAIVFRISEWGFTPNRAAVMGSNILILINLLLVTVQLYRVLFKHAETGMVGKAIAVYLPVYVAWAVVVTFVFPLVFGFK